MAAERVLHDQKSLFFSRTNLVPGKNAQHSPPRGAPPWGAILAVEIPPRGQQWHNTSKMGSSPDSHAHLLCFLQHFCCLPLLLIHLPHEPNTCTISLRMALWCFNITIWLKNNVSGILFCRKASKKQLPVEACSLLDCCSFACVVLTNS